MLPQKGEASAHSASKIQASSTLASMGASIAAASGSAPASISPGLEEHPAARNRTSSLNADLGDCRITGGDYTLGRVVAEDEAAGGTLGVAGVLDPLAGHGAGGADGGAD